MVPILVEMSLIMSVEGPPRTSGQIIQLPRHRQEWYSQRNQRGFCKACLLRKKTGGQAVFLFRLILKQSAVLLNLSFDYMIIHKTVLFLIQFLFSFQQMLL